MTSLTNRRRPAMLAMAALLAGVLTTGERPVRADAGQAPQAAEPAAPAAEPAKRGILLLAHGGRAAWNERVTTLAGKVSERMPIEVAFGMASRPAIQSAVDKLVAAGVTEIVAVPLFVSDHSSVVTSTAYLLGARKDMPEDLRMFAKMDHGSHGAPAPAAPSPAPASAAAPASGTHQGHGSGSSSTASAAAPSRGGHAGHAGHGTAEAATAPAAATPDGTQPIASPVPVRMTKALGRHPVVADILATRAGTISKVPGDEAVVLVAHGPVADEENRLWLADMESLTAGVRQAAPFASVDALTVRDDAPPEIRDAATAELRALVTRRAGEGKRVLIVPLLMSYGGIEGGIRKRLEGLDYTMPEQGLMPDDRLVTWVIDMASTRSHD